jgi:hypothetical protein
MRPELVSRQDLLTTLRMLEVPREGGEGPHFTPAVSAVLACVPDAVEEIEGLELPLPEPGFADRTGQLTAGA